MYAGFGPLHEFLPVSQQFQEVWAVVDPDSKVVNVEAGVGVGHTAGADRLTFKLMLSRDLNTKHEQRTREQNLRSEGTVVDDLVRAGAEIRQRNFSSAEIILGSVADCADEITSYTFFGCNQRL